MYTNTELTHTVQNCISQALIPAPSKINGMYVYKMHSQCTYALGYNLSLPYFQQKVTDTYGRNLNNQQVKGTVA